MIAAHKEATPKASGSSRDVYSAPRLVRYGPLPSLTTSGTRAPMEHTGGTETGKRP